MRTLPIPEQYIIQMKRTQQNPRFHAEGNVYNHTMLVLEQFFKHVNEFNLSAEDQEVLYWAAILHDLGKTKVTRLVEGRWIARGHESAGVPIARNILLSKPEITPEQRHRILNIVRWHHVPMRWGLVGTKYTAYKRLSTQTDIRLLGIFALFDVMGRICVNKSHVLEVIDHFNEVIVPRIKYEFGSHNEIQNFFDEANYKKKNALWHALKADDIRLLERVMYRPPEKERTPQTNCIISIGPPKSGKTTYLRQSYPDHQYFDFDAPSGQTPQHIEQKKIDRSLSRLRKSLSNPFGEERKVVIDGMNLNVAQRKYVMEYVRDCGSTVHYVFFEKSLEEIRANNQKSSCPIEETRIQAAYEKLYFPHPWESHSLEVVA